MSNNFQTVQFSDLKWPAQMLVDYVRVYQRADGKVGCDPADRPTANYIANHANAYNNPNFTTWEAAGYTRPVSVFYFPPADFLSRGSTMLWMPKLEDRESSE